ncbi:MAG: FtsX-like permease family protein [Myxococcota bacterium]
MTLSSLAVKNIRRNPLRNVLTVLGVAIAIMSFILIRTTLAAWSTAAEYAAQDRLTTMHKVTFVMPLPRKYYDDFDGSRGTVPGVQVATYANWFGAKHPTREQEFFANFAVHSDTYFQVYHDMEVPPEQLAAWKDNRRGAIVGAALANKFGWSVGDEVTLAGTIYPGDWKFTIEGVYETTSRAVDRSQFIFHWKFLNESVDEEMREQIGWIATRLDSGVNSADVVSAIDTKFDTEDVQTRTLTERAMNLEFIGSASALLQALDYVSGVILVIMMLILGNTIAMGVRERTHEFGVLLAIGFRPKHIVAFILGEGVVIGLLGGGVGLLLSYPFVEQGLGRFLEENMGAYFPYFRIPPFVAGLSLACAAALAALAAILPAWRASKLDVVSALRRLG